MISFIVFIQASFIVFSGLTMLVFKDSNLDSEIRTFNIASIIFIVSFFSIFLFPLLIVWLEMG
jgi:hypothetical protein